MSKCYYVLLGSLLAGLFLMLPPIPAGAALTLAMSAFGGNVLQNSLVAPFNSCDDLLA